jgi:nucleoside 2-deoxyribosyltransferase
VAATKEPDGGERLRSIFVISPIGKKDDDGVDFTKIFLEQIVKPAAATAGGFRPPVRADEVKAPGSITAKIVSDIVNADVCVADLTGRNPNVMYEVAIAHAAGKPVILLQQEEGGPPFDFTGERTIHYSIRADEANQARDDLVEHLRNADHEEADPQLKRTMNPVRVIFEDLRTKAQAGPTDRAILDRLDSLGAEIRELREGERRGSGTSSGVRADAGDGVTFGDLLNLRSQLEALATSLRQGTEPPPSAGMRRAISEVERVLAKKGLTRAARQFIMARNRWETQGGGEDAEGANDELLETIKVLLHELDSPIRMGER